VLGFCLLLAAAPAAQAARGMEVAISDEDAMVNGRGGNPLRAYQTAQALNATRMRILCPVVRRGRSEQFRPVGAIDDAIDAAARYGMRTQLDLAGPAPPGAAGVYKSLCILRPDPAAYADFVSSAAEHFRGVDRYSIWDEPKYPAWLAPLSQSPRPYLALFVAGYRAIKSVDSGAQVLTGETVPYGGTQKGKELGLATPPLKWLRGVACVTDRYRRVGAARRSRATATPTTPMSSPPRRRRRSSPAPTTRPSRRSGAWTRR
jgi:hypothetical protein